jgi:hypothetical protein
MIQQPGRNVRVEHDTHHEGLFDRATWHDLIKRAGLEPISVDVPDPYADDHEVFVSQKPS